jgi:hypothetical protein
MSTEEIEAGGSTVGSGPTVGWAGATILQHVVLFGFPSALSQDETHEFDRLIRSFPLEIGSMRDLRIGQDLHLVGDRSQGFQYLMEMEFADVATFRAYRAHPAHVRLSEFIRARDCRVLAFDYFVDAMTVIQSK